MALGTLYRQTVGLVHAARFPALPYSGGRALFLHV